MYWQTFKNSFLLHFHISRLVNFTRKSALVLTKQNLRQNSVIDQILGHLEYLLETYIRRPNLTSSTNWRDHPFHSIAEREGCCASVSHDHCIGQIDWDISSDMFNTTSLIEEDIRLQILGISGSVLLVFVIVAVLMGIRSKVTQTPINHLLVIDCLLCLVCFWSQISFKIILTVLSLLFAKAFN